MKFSQPSPSNIVTAQISDDQVTLAKLKYAICVVRNSVAQAFVTAVTAAMAWNTELTDTDALHDNVVNNTRFTVPAGFTFARVTANCSWAANATGFRSAEVRLNGAQPNGAGVTQVAVNSAAAASVFGVRSALIAVVAGDFIEIFGLQNSGVNLDWQTSFSSWAMVELFG